MQYFDVWQVDTTKLMMRSYVEDEYGRLSSDIGEWEAIPASLQKLVIRLADRGYRCCRPAIIEKWMRPHVWR